MSLEKVISAISYCALCGKTASHKDSFVHSEYGHGLLNGIGYHVTTIKCHGKLFKLAYTDDLTAFNMGIIKTAVFIICDEDVNVGIHVIPPKFWL